MVGTPGGSRHVERLGICVCAFVLEFGLAGRVARRAGMSACVRLVGGWAGQLASWHAGMQIGQEDAARQGGRKAVCRKRECSFAATLRHAIQSSHRAQ